MAEDLVKRLREAHANSTQRILGSDIFEAAAGLIEQQAAAVAARDAEIERLRRYLHPYADDTEISGMSWSGFHLIGNKKSIAELHRIENRSSQLDVFRAAFDERAKAAEFRAEQAEHSADHWRRAVEIIATIIGLPEPEADFASKVRDAFDALRSQLHDANGVADLAIKHRDEAERALTVLAPVRDMLILCDELGGIQPGEEMSSYLRRLIDEVAGKECERAFERN